MRPGTPEGAGPCRFLVQGVDESRLSGRRSELDCYVWVEVLNCGEERVDVYRANLSKL